MTAPIITGTEGQKNLHYQHFLPDLHARRRKAKAKERAALEPTLAKPSTPLLAGRGLKRIRAHTDQLNIIILLSSL